MSCLLAFILIGSGTKDIRQPLILPTRKQGHEATTNNNQKQNPKKGKKTPTDAFLGAVRLSLPPANNPAGFKKWAGQAGIFPLIAEVRAGRAPFNPSQARAGFPQAPPHTCPPPTPRHAPAPALAQLHGHTLTDTRTRPEPRPSRGDGGTPCPFPCPAAPAQPGGGEGAAAAPLAALQPVPVPANGEGTASSPF